MRRRRHCPARAGRRCRRRTSYFGELEIRGLAEEGVRDLEQDARAVAGVGLGACGAAVLKIPQDGQRLFYQLMAGNTGEGGHEPDAAGVVFVTGSYIP